MAEFSISDPNKLIDGIEAINQQILLAITTVKGSDPYRADFGTTIFSQIDSEVKESIPIIKVEIINVLAAYVPNITVVSVYSEYKYGKTNFTVLWQEKISGISGKTII